MCKILFSLCQTLVIDWLIDLLIDLLKDEDASVCSSGYSSEAESEEASIVYYKVATIYTS